MTSPKSRAAGAFSRDIALLRGGRLRKTSRGLLTFAPFLATASAVALGALLSLTPTDSAHAQMCSDPMTDGMSVCSESGTTAVTVTVPAGYDLTLTDMTGFSITAATGHALQIEVPSGSGTRNVNATLTGNLTAGTTGSSAHGIDIIGRGTSAITISTSGTITARASSVSGISGYHYGRGDITITTSGAITSNGAGGDGITATLPRSNTGNNIIIDVAAAVTVPESDAGAFAIDMQNGGSHTLRLRTGADITGTVRSSRTDATLEILGSITFDPPSSFTNISLASSADTTASTGDRLTVTNFAKGGTLALNADFMADSAAADRLIITGMITGTDATMITLTATGELSDLPSNMPLTLIEAPTGTGAAGDFALTDTTLNDAFSRDSATGDWIITGTGEAVTPPPTGGNGGNGGDGMPPMPAVMNDCDDGVNGTYTCAGAVADTTTQMFTADSGTLTVNAATLDSITVAMGPAFDLDGMDGSMGINATFGGTITASAGDGIDADHAGSGPVSITANAITATGGTGIAASTTATDATTMTITTNGAIMATGTEMGDAGISASHMGSGDLTITANADVTGNTGISAAITNTGNTVGDITVTIGGEIDGDDGTADNDDTAIAMTGGGNHRLVINSGGSIADGDSVTSDATGDRTATLALNAAAGETTGSFDLSDLENFHDGDDTTPAKAFTAFEKTGAGTWTLTGDQTMDSSNMPIDREFASASVMAGTLQLSGATLALGDDTALEVASGATLQVMGSSASTIMGDVSNSGTLQVNADLELGAGATLTIDSGATLNFMGDSKINAASGDATLELTGAGDDSFALSDLDSNYDGFNAFSKTGTGTWTLIGAQPTNETFASAEVTAGILQLAFDDNASTDDGLTVTGAFTGGGSVTLNVDLTDANAPAVTTLSLGSVTGSAATSVRLRIAGDAANLPVDGLQLIDVDGARADAFMVAENNPCTTIGGSNCTFTMEHSTTGWTLTALEVLGSDILYENYAASLAELSRVSGMRARFGNRIWATEEGRGIWARAEASNSELEPNTPSETSAAYEIRDTRLRFGVDAPIRAVPGLILGGNVWLARADTDITAAGEDTGKIETEGYALAATAHWQASTGFYVDGQAQFAAFTSDLSSAGETRVDGNDGRGITLAAEVGYPVPVREFTITPQAQLSWSDVDFDDFTASDNDARISLGDGETVDARIGVSVDRRWSERSGTLGHVWGALDLRAPLDGETSARVGEDAPLISEREEPALGLGMGVSFLLRDNTSIAAELATTQGDEIEEYKGSLALRFTF